jgi:hypothetical protein
VGLRRDRGGSSQIRADRAWGAWTSRDRIARAGPIEGGIRESGFTDPRNVDSSTAKDGAPAGRRIFRWSSAPEPRPISCSVSAWWIGRGSEPHSAPRLGACASSGAAHCPRPPDFEGAGACLGPCSRVTRHSIERALAASNLPPELRIDDASKNRAPPSQQRHVLAPMASARDRPRRHPRGADAGLRRQRRATAVAGGPTLSLHHRRRRDRGVGARARPGGSGRALLRWAHRAAGRATCARARSHAQRLRPGRVRGALRAARRLARGGRSARSSRPRAGGDERRLLRRRARRARAVVRGLRRLLERRWRVRFCGWAARSTARSPA